MGRNRLQLQQADHTEPHLAQMSSWFACVIVLEGTHLCEPLSLLCAHSVFIVAWAPHSCPYTELLAGLQWSTTQVPRLNEWSCVVVLTRLLVFVLVQASGSGRPSVINLSLGGPQSSIINSAVDAAVAAGIVVVTSAGNVASDACNFSPASATNAIVVAASTGTDTAALFSNQGPCIDIYAPGLSVTSASAVNNSGSIVVSGTTIAAPLVTGVIARLRAELPSYTPAQIWSLLVCLSSNGTLTSVPTNTVNRLLHGNATIMFWRVSPTF